MRYVGSKAKYSKQIVPILQKIIDDGKMDTYIEPFVGGANVIDKIKCKDRYGFDIDPLPIELLKIAQKKPEIFEKLPKTISKEHYYFIRDNGQYVATEWYKAAVLMFASYNARVYGGCYGATATTKEGKVRDYWNESIENFKKQIPQLEGIFFGAIDYSSVTKVVAPRPNKTLIYCDPPYQSGIGYKDKFNHEEFWEWVRDMSKIYTVVVSEETAPEDFVAIWQSESRSHMNYKKTKTKVEKLFILNKSENKS